MAATATCTDSQRLIAMSLGKIAASRSQRGGACLHKSLLVSHVLHKARTAFMMENFQAMLHARQQQHQQTCAQQLEQEEADQVVPEVEAPLTPHPAMRAEETQPGDRVGDGEPTHHYRSSIPYQDTDEEDDKENSPPAHKQPLEVSTENLPCGKCTVKRRLCQDSEPEMGEEKDRASSPPSSKRAKGDTPSSPSPCPPTPPPSCPDPSSPSQPEPMQTEAISSLVHRFNSGLSGFLTYSNSQNCAQQSPTPSHHQETTSTQIDGLISCATQVVENVRFQDSLSRPVIALTV